MFCPSWAPLPLWGCRRPEATRLPLPLHGAPPWCYPPFRKPCALPPSPTLWDSGSTLEALQPPLFPPTPEGSAPTFVCRPPSCPPCPCLYPWRPHVPASSVVAEGVFLSSLPPACVCTRSPPDPLYCVPHGDAVSVSSLTSRSLAGIPSSSLSGLDSSSLPTHHPSLSASLSPFLDPQRSPLSPSLLTCYLWPLCPRPASAIVLSLAVVPLPVSVMPRGLPQASPFRLPSHVPTLFSSCWPLRPLAPPLALLPLAPAGPVGKSPVGLA